MKEHPFAYRLLDAGAALRTSPALVLDVLKWHAHDEGWPTDWSTRTLWISRFSLRDKNFKLIPMAKMMQCEHIIAGELCGILLKAIQCAVPLAHLVDPKLVTDV